jgi:uncharacterized protein (DUF2062 family)
MAFKDNWRRHVLSLLEEGTEEGASRELDRDFWPKEDIWDPAVRTQYRWLKFLWVSFARSAISAGFPMAVLCFIMYFFGLTVAFAVFAVSTLTLFGTLIFFLSEMAVFWIAYRKYKKNQQQPPPP